MPEENDNEGGLEEGAEEQSYFVDNPSLDLEATSNAYEGLAKLYRLQFIAEHCPCYRVEALKLAITAVQSTYNTTLYQRLHRKLQECIGGPANAGAAGLPDVAVGAADQVLFLVLSACIQRVRMVNCNVNNKKVEPGQHLYVPWLAGWHHLWQHSLQQPHQAI